MLLPAATWLPPRQTEAVCRVFDMLHGADTLIVVDPAMADHGRLYNAPLPRIFPGI